METYGIEMLTRGASQASESMQSYLARWRAIMDCLYARAWSAGCCGWEWTHCISTVSALVPSMWTHFSVDFKWEQVLSVRDFMHGGGPMPFETSGCQVLTHTNTHTMGHSYLYAETGK